MAVGYNVLNRLSGRADGPAGSHSGFAVSFVVIDCCIDHDDTVSGFIGILRGAFGQPCDAENRRDNADQDQHKGDQLFGRDSFGFHSVFSFSP